MMRWPFVSRRERLRRHAADWLARLNGPHDAREREAFERWYRASADHAAAYDRLSAVFSAAANIASKPDADVSELQKARLTRTSLRYALAAAAVLCVVVLGFMLLAARTAAPTQDAQVQSAVFAASEGKARTIVLIDGSQVVLAPGGELAVTLDAKERRLRLKRGEGRFTVVHESRPFIVEAKDTQVIARGTQFVVRLGEEGTLVSLIEGRIDVTYPASPHRMDRRVVGLAAGQRLIVPNADGPPARSGTLTETRPSPAMLEFDNTRLADALEQVNRQRTGRIRLADPALGELRVTGAFRTGNVEEFAQAVAAAFDLELERGAHGSLWLRSSRARTPRR